MTYRTPASSSSFAWASGGDSINVRWSSDGRVAEARRLGLAKRVYWTVVTGKIYVAGAGDLPASQAGALLKGDLT